MHVILCKIKYVIAQHFVLKLYLDLRIFTIKASTSKLWYKLTVIICNESFLSLNCIHVKKILKNYCQTYHPLFHSIWRRTKKNEKKNEDLEKLVWTT